MFFCDLEALSHVMLQVTTPVMLNFDDQTVAVWPSPSTPLRERGLSIKKSLHTSSIIKNYACFAVRVNTVM